MPKGENAEAVEQLRQRAEGFGRPIRTGVVAGRRWVEVGPRRFWGHWPYFTDFLIAYLVGLLGTDWSKSHPPSLQSVHPVSRWLSLLRQQRSNDGAPGGVIAIEGDWGFTSGLFQVANALYLLAHHDEIPADLLRRLRRPSDFRSAAYEALAAAAFAKAGFRIESAETKRSAQTKPEFIAVPKGGGKTFSVEAKCRQNWKHSARELVDLGQEVGNFIGNKIYRAAIKGLSNPIYWIELGLADPRETWKDEQLFEIISSAVRAAEERITVAGSKPRPAYVFVTNHPFFEVDGLGAAGQFVMLDGFHMPYFRNAVWRSWDDLFDARDQHRDILRVQKAFSAVQAVPITWDGLPSELMGPDGQPISTMRLGEMLALDFPTGEQLTGEVTEITTLGDQAWVILKDPGTGKHNMVTVELNEQERIAVARHGDLVFGKPMRNLNIPKDDPLAWYDWFLEIYAETPREKLLEIVQSGTPPAPFAARMTDSELRIYVARGYARSVISDLRSKGKG